MSREDELREILDETARSIAEISHHPRTWNGWLAYLLERLEEQANSENTSYRMAYKEMLSALEDNIRNWRRTGGW